jgi:hypothetical protein
MNNEAQTSVSIFDSISPTLHNGQQKKCSSCATNDPQ